MDKKRADYINFPVELLAGFLDGDHRANMLNFISWEYGTRAENGENLEDFLEIIEMEPYGNDIAERALRLRETVKPSAYTGLTADLWKSFIFEEKIEKEKVTLLAFLAAKSIVGEDPYKRLTALFIYSRMEGRRDGVDFYAELSTIIQKYSSQHHQQRIREELEEYYGLQWVLSRGWYFSFTMSYEELYRAVTTKRRKKKEKTEKLSSEKKAIREKVNRETRPG